MNSRSINNEIELNPLRVCEVMGPAGAGKSTLINKLLKHSKKFHLDFSLANIKKIPYFIGNTYLLLPTYLRHYRNDRWFSWRETRSMVYLRTGLDVLGKQKENNNIVTLLDHGPIYRLAFLREFGSEITKSEVYINWWTELLHQWIETLDLLIILDAPNEILLERIRNRNHKHSVKYSDDYEGFEYLNRYRKSFQQTMSESMIEFRLPVFRYDTSQLSTQQLFEEVLANLNQPQFHIASQEREEIFC